MKRILSLILLIIPLYIAYFLFYSPSAEEKLKKKTAAAFERQSSDVVMVRDITDFDWDTVCYVPPYSTKSFNFLEDEYKDILRSHLPFVGSPIPINYGEYYFIKDTEVVQSYSFSSLGLRYSKGQSGASAIKIPINNEYYLFMSEHNSENDSCISRDNAAFKKTYNPQWNVRRIRITNLEKSKS